MQKETKQTVFTQDQQLVNADTRITGVTQPGNRTEQNNCHVYKKHGLGIIKEFTLTS